ncbi:hypothetical protein BGX34_001885 [Mortierella sp. NVP85]|nr:hypothetical protein BGX34_001885 [Mortierella sp. NVP85]
MSTQSARSSPGRSSEHGNNTTGFQDQDRASTISSSSTPFSQSNSTSQIFEETSFFNQLPIHESLSRGHQRTETGHHDGSMFQPSPFAQPQGIYGLGFLDQTPFFSRSSHRGHGDDDDEEEEDRDEDEDGVHAGKDRDGSSQDGSGPLREEIRHLHPEEELAFLPSGGMSASSVLTKATEGGYQRRAVLGNNMPFQLDDELASLGTRGLEEILGHEGGDEEEDHRVRGIRFKEAVEPSRVRSQGEVLSSASRKSSAQNSVGSSFSDLSDSISRSALEEEYLAGYNNSNNSNNNSSTHSKM